MPSRMGFDLTTKIGWKNLRYASWRSARHYFLRDTFSKIWCLVVGHIEYDTFNGLACKRCQQYIIKKHKGA
jgi:hypothetical protein